MSSSGGVFDSEISTRTASIKRGIAQELHRSKRRKYYRRDVIIRDFKDMFQCDLIEMIPYAQQNQGYRYILAVIDSFSKYAWTRPLRRKNGDEVGEAMNDILESDDGVHLKPPRLLCSDHGKEFYNSKFQAVMTKFNIKHYSVYSDKKACIVERFIRTLKNMIYFEFTATRSYRWFDTLDMITVRYNSSIHRTISMKPAEVRYEHRQFLQNIYSSHHRNKRRSNVKFKVGDCVRIARQKPEFEKSYTPNWSSELFYISKINDTFPVTYQLIDSESIPVRGGFYSEELLKTRFPNLYLVKKVIRHGSGSRQNEVLVQLHGMVDKIWLPRQFIL